jgi:hypothetical protein
MLSRLIRMRWPLPVAAVILMLGIGGWAVVAARAGGASLVVYNGRAH